MRALMGRPCLPPELRRDSRVTLCVRSGQLADLNVLADAWGVTLGTAAWAIIATYLDECRSMPTELTPDLLSIRSACLMLSRLGDIEGAA